jgi:hypothetical protein
MIQFLADEDFNGRIVRGLWLCSRTVDIVRAQDVGLSNAEDAQIREWAEQFGRLVLTHDRSTMPDHSRRRLSLGLHLPGIFIVDDRAPIGKCIEDILLIAECSEADEWHDQIYYLPFK